MGSAACCDGLLRIEKRLWNDLAVPITICRPHYGLCADIGMRRLHESQRDVLFEARRIDGGRHITDLRPVDQDRPVLVIRTGDRVTTEFKAHLTLFRKCTYELSRSRFTPQFAIFAEPLRNRKANGKRRSFRVRGSNVEAEVAEVVFRN